MEGETGAATNKGVLASTTVVAERFCSEEKRELTVRKTSLFHPGDGFAAYDNNTGDLVFRVDTYARRSALTDQLLLMNPSGEPILTLQRKWPSLHQRWEGFLGESSEGQKPIFTMRKSSIFGHGRDDILVEVLHEGAAAEEYRIEGSFPRRCCKVLYEGGGTEKEEVVVVAEIKRKVDVASSVVLGRDVLSLCLRPHCDAAFAMGLVIVLDQITGGHDDIIDDDTATATEIMDETDRDNFGGHGSEKVTRIDPDC